MLNNFNCPETIDTHWLKMPHGRNSHRHPNRIVVLNRCLCKFVFNLSRIYSICCDVSLSIHFACLFHCLSSPKWNTYLMLWGRTFILDSKELKIQWQWWVPSYEIFFPTSLIAKCGHMTKFGPIGHEWRGWVQLLSHLRSYRLFGLNSLSPVIGCGMVMTRATLGDTAALTALH